jgi:hypothetical protein
MAKGGSGKPADPRRPSKRNEPSDYHSEPRDEPLPVVDPLTPRPKLFVVLVIVFAVWMAFLVFLYFKTVYAHRSTAPKGDVALLLARGGTAQSIS